MTTPAPSASRILTFYLQQDTGTVLPGPVSLLNPFIEPEVLRVNNIFYQKYYSDCSPRVLILGINPGRFGAGVTGLPFTDPVRLELSCGIPNAFEKRAELSSNFIYQVIEAYGGCRRFYSDFLFGAVSPLGFMRDGKNLNYYDDKELYQSLRNYLLRSLEAQAGLAGRRDMVICLGEGKNYDELRRLNDERPVFSRILPLPHPRFIMQYRRRQLDAFIRLYLEKLELAQKSTT